MRTSNKILLGLFLTTIIVFASLFISVRVMYANGRIVQRERVNNWSDIHRINEPIREVRLDGIGDIMIIPSDSAKLEIWKDNQEVRWRMKDGILYVEADTTRKGQAGGKRLIYGHIELSLPNVDRIVATSSNFMIKNVADSARFKPVYRINLQNSELTFEENRRDEQVTFYDQVIVNARERSALKFNGKVWVSELQVSLSASHLEDGDASFGKLNIQTDSFSDIHIDGRNLRKAIITSTE